MRIALIGYGKMGHEIEKIAIERGHSISGIIDINNAEDLNPSLNSESDVAIEFTTPESVINNLYRCFEIGLPVVAGTTGWHEKLNEVMDRCREGNCSLFYASNFSIGVNLFFAMNKKFAKLMEKFPQYDVSISETHHTQKIDSPSGTAVTLANLISEELSGKNGWTSEKPNKRDIQIEAFREGDIKGIHTVKYDSDIDFITLTHHAKSRRGFATGAVLAAEYLYGKNGIFTMRDLLDI